MYTLLLFLFFSNFNFFVMAKNVFHDIVTKERRTIREVPLPRGRKQPEPVEEDSILYESEEVHIEEEPETTSSLPWRKIVLWGVAVFFVGLLGFFLISSFTGATVTVTPKTITVSVSSEFTATKEPTAKLQFQTLPITEVAELVIPADTTKKVQEKAKGTIVIYNNFSDKPQRLVKNTRFETKSGLIFRIDSSITVPGRTIKDGRKVPGSLETTVMADSPGIEYNILLADFTVPGFKTDAARFAGFYARSKTPMTGGFEGTLKVPSESALIAARASLRDTLKKKVSGGKQAEVPEGFILFPGALAVQNESLQPEEREGGMSAVREKLTGSAYLFKYEDLAKAVAQTSIPNFNNLPIEVPNLLSLLFELKELPTGNPADAKAIRFTLRGNAHIVWLYDAEKLKSTLAGKQKSELLAALSNFPTLEKADLVIRPFWSSTIPSNIGKITVKETAGTLASQKP